MAACHLKNETIERPEPVPPSTFATVVVSFCRVKDLRQAHMKGDNRLALRTKRNARIVVRSRHLKDYTRL
jgi:hypothetical protein